MLRIAFLWIWVPFGAMQSCSEQLTVEIRPCLKVRYLFVRFVCIRALNASSVMYRVIRSIPQANMGGGLRCV